MAADAAVRAARAAGGDVPRARGRRHPRAMSSACPPRSAPRAALELVHDASHVERVLAEPRADRQARPRGMDRPGQRHRRAARGRRDARGGRRGGGGRARQRVRARAAAGPPRRGGAADGLLPAQRDRRAGALGAARARRGAGRDPRLGRPPRQRHRGDLPRRRHRADDLAAPGRAVPGRHRRGRRARRGDRQRAAPGRHRRRGLRAGLRARGRARDPRLRARPAARSARARTPRRATRWAGWR